MQKCFSIFLIMLPTCPISFYLDVRNHWSIAKINIIFLANSTACATALFHYLSLTSITKIKTKCNNGGSMPLSSRVRVHMSVLFRLLTLAQYLVSNLKLFKINMLAAYQVAWQKEHDYINIHGQTGLRYAMLVITSLACPQTSTSQCNPC